MTDHSIRETVARIIDPERWDQTDRLPGLVGPYTVDQWCRESLAIADAIHTAYLSAGWRRDRSDALWLKAAERALEAIPGASNSTHPAHSLWLRVELAKAPPVDVVLSASPQPEVKP